MDRTLQSRLTNPRNDIERKIARFGPWFHNLRLPDGTQTAPNHPLGDFPTVKWEQFRSFIPEDLTGWTVLDIGCNAGFYSFEMAKRNAQVTAIDVNPHYLAQAEWAAQQYGVSGRINFMQMQVYDLVRMKEEFDLVLFLGVFYHLRYPTLGLDIVASKARRRMVFQTLTMPGEGEAQDTSELQFPDLWKMLGDNWPKMAYVEHRFEDDPTNWWLPNHAGIQAILRTAGMKCVEHPADGIYICEPAPGLLGPRVSPAELLAATGLRKRDE